MDKLIITATVDSTISWPGNEYMPPIEDTDAVARQYVDAVSAGAAICHHHGVHYLDDVIQADGRKLSRIDFDGWQNLSDAIRSGGGDPIIQYGIASARVPEKIRLMDQQPDMMSYCFHPHDERFQPDPTLPAIEMYALHPRDELAEIASAAVDHDVKLDIECFYTGGFFNLEFIRDQGLLPDPCWVTLFFDWKGGTWTPPTLDALLYMTSHLPKNVNWTTSIMNPVAAWHLIPSVIALGGHVRVGWEDNPYLPNGELAKSNAQLVECVVKLAELIGRDVASPQEARAIAGLSKPPVPVFAQDGAGAAAAGAPSEAAGQP
jgi:3-keto-5-aminohexanoate cleavage enzyme